MAKAIAVSENERLRAENERLHARIAFLQEQLALAFFKRYGRSAESFKDQPDLPFADELEAIINQQDKAELETITYERKKPGRKSLAEELPREHLYHDLSEAEKTCACGQPMTKIGEDVSERLNVVPAKVWVEAHHHAKYACPHCQGINDSEASAVKRAAGGEPLIPGSIVTPGLAAFIWTNKFCDHLPFYRQEICFDRIGATVSRQDMSNWTIRLAADLEPLIQRLEQHIRAGPVIQMDETPVKVLKLDRTGKDGTGYMWLARGGTEQQPAVRYRFAPGRGAGHAATFLGDYSGFVQTDGYQAYDSLAAAARWVHVGCWAHARRKFYEAEKVAHSALLTEALSRIKKLYALEYEARKLPDEPGVIQGRRRALLQPFLVDFKQWLDATMTRVLPAGKTGEAFAYTIGQWDKLLRFFDHYTLTPDNNRALCSGIRNPQDSGKSSRSNKILRMVA